METENIDYLYKMILRLPIGTKEYQKCLEKIRFSETGGHTLGLSTSLTPVKPSSNIVDIKISKSL